MNKNELETPIPLKEQRFQSFLERGTNYKISLDLWWKYVNQLL